MRRALVGLGVLSLLVGGFGVCLLVAVAAVEQGEFPQLSRVFSSRTPTPSATPRPTQTATPLPASATPSPAPTATRNPTATPSPTPADLYLTQADIFVHPGPSIYAGDLVSFEVLANDGAGMGLEDLGVAVYGGEPEQREQLGFARMGLVGVGRRQQATFNWVWDTSDLSGAQSITVVLDPDDEYQIGDEDPDNNRVTLRIDVLPPEARPSSEVGMRWVATESACCVFNYMTNSAAARDIDYIVETAEEATAYVETMLDVEREDKIVFDFVNRVVGHGGFASDSITISYLDRNYVGGHLPSTIRHEVSHVLDRRLSSERPVLITEGLAVYVAGGHFKPEQVMPRMVAAHAAGLALPLVELADSFYPAQHELSYLQASAFVDYLITTYGWDGFRLFLQSIRMAGSESAAIDAAALVGFGRDLHQLELDWLESLEAVSPDPLVLADVEATVALYDTARRYQLALDPSAHFLTAWIPSIEHARENGIVADYTRRSSAPENIALELMLASANAALEASDYGRTQDWIEAANAVLDAGVNFGAHPLAAQTYEITRATLAAGYEPQQLELGPERATVAAIVEWPYLVELEYQLSLAGWRLSQ